MLQKSLFIVIEGLDGSGKSSASAGLQKRLEMRFPQQVLRTYEPHNDSCGGLFIRDILEKRITRFHPRVLALAFAANRLDHCARRINPWLEKGGIVLCDRYYLSSLVYQSSDDFSMKKVMELNEKARQPDLIFFLNVSAEVCYERMQIRNQPPELFEQNLEHTRLKYRQAIDFLEQYQSQSIIEINGNQLLSQVVADMETALAPWLSPLFRP